MRSPHSKRLYLRYWPPPWPSPHLALASSGLWKGQPQVLNTSDHPLEQPLALHLLVLHPLEHPQEHPLVLHPLEHPLLLHPLEYPRCCTPWCCNP